MNTLQTKAGKISAPQTAETVFDILYLVSVLCMAVFLLCTVQGEPLRALYGSMALVLVLGDSFHLVPRILHIAHPQNQKITTAMGVGKAVTSVTMTAFYVMLYYVWLLYYGGRQSPVLTLTIWLLALVRVGLCVLPQNNWLRPSGENRFSIYRNLPFFLLGVLVAVLYAVQAMAFPFEQNPLALMWVAIVFSFGFYLPVVLFSAKQPKVGMLMLPKTCMYIWIVVMGLFL